MWEKPYYPTYYFPEADIHPDGLVPFETGFPVWYYLPKTDVCMDLLTPTETRSHCPYKGTAEYWTVTVNRTDHEDFAWSCRTPLAESARIGGFVDFYNKKVDHIIDGDLVERPTTIFSRRHRGRTGSRFVGHRRMERRHANMTPADPSAVSAESTHMES